MNILDTLKPIGEWLSAVTSKILALVPSAFLESDTTAKIVSIIIYVGVIWAILKFAGALSKPIKWVLVVLFILLIVSVISTFI